MKIEDVLVTEDAKVNFLKGLIRVAKCDNSLESNELSYYMQVASTMNLSDSSKEQINKSWVGNEKIKVSFEQRREKLFYFIQAIQLCWIDDVYQDDERKEIRDIAKELGIEEEVILKIEKWVDEGIAWNKRGDTLLDL